ncbi:MULTISPECIES: ABC transporter permease [unclassified Streptomyces]|uniref:ABC transporter permease n=1 Tax=unclassified Streptomyces TaxID=2593676 RepID=UPI002DDA3FA4|nr:MULTISPECIES: ABC transporter permease subunit [unclassified Streptomyces]WSE02768.1 ABC transporter permease subunit [Streptomyces sp. NBC_01445]
MHTFFASFSFMADHFGLLADRTVDHLKLSAAAVAVALVLALPLGVWLGHRGKGSFLTVSISNIGRALPSLALIAIFLGLLGIGFVNVLTALVVMAVPPVLTHAYLSVEQVDPDLVRAGRGMGLTEWQILTRIELPLALPVLFTGIRIAAVYVISSATLAAVAGGGGLGDIILNQVSYGLSGVIAAALWVAVLALAADALFGALRSRLTPRGVLAGRSG